MAIIKLGALVAGVRGTVGGVTFSAGAAGPTAKLWSRGPNPRTRPQGRQRLRISLMPEYWRVISDSQREAWITWAADPAQARTNSLGELYQMTGFQAFCYINLNLLRSGLSWRQDPPDDTTPPAPVIDSFSFAEVMGVFTCEIIYDPAEFPSGTGIVLEAAFVPRGGRMVQYNGWRLLLDGIASPTGTYPFPSEWAAQFGVPRYSDRGFIRVYKQTDQGQRSTSWNAYQDYA